MSRKRVMGFSMVLLGALFWGISGTVAQRLFSEGLEPGWLVTIRLLFSGLFLLLIELRKSSVFKAWRSLKNSVQLLVFGLIGMLGVQYTYFASIKYGNAAAATLLQYLAPVFLIVFLILRYRKRPKYKEVLGVILAILGTFLLVTNGQLHGLTISTKALLWGIVSALALAFYTLYPSHLLKQLGTGVVVGWGMLIGGIGLSFVNPPWESTGFEWSWMAFIYVGFVVIFGTLLAFYLYMNSLNYIEPQETSLLGCAEPLSAAIVSIFWLHTPFGGVQAGGGLCILATVILLAFKKRKQSVEAPQTVNELTIDPESKIIEQN